MTFCDLWPRFQGHNILWSRKLEERNVLKTKLLLHNRKLYVTCGMVPCVVTLTDLEMCRAGLSASADLLVYLLAPSTPHECTPRLLLAVWNRPNTVYFQTSLLATFCGDVNACGVRRTTETATCLILSLTQSSHLIELFRCLRAILVSYFPQNFVWPIFSTHHYKSVWTILRIVGAEIFTR